MSGTELWALPATELAARIRRREVSPVEVAETVLARLERLNGRLGAFCTPTPDLALAMAREAEAAVVEGAPLGPLHGVPVSTGRMSVGHRLKPRFLESGVVRARPSAAGLGERNHPGPHAACTPSARCPGRARILASPRRRYEPDSAVTQ